MPEQAKIRVDVILAGFVRALDDHGRDHAAGVMRCGQAVTKDVPGAYTADIKLGEH